jgi:hypothetical protein
VWKQKQKEAIWESVLHQWKTKEELYSVGFVSV